MATNDQVNTMIRNLKTLINERLKLLLREEGLGVAGVKVELQARLLQRIHEYARQGNQARLDRLQTSIQGMMRPGTYNSYSNYNSPPSHSPQYPLSNPRNTGSGSAYSGSMPPQGSPSREIRFSRSPFYNVERCLAGPVECKVRENTRDQIEIKLNLSAELVSQLSHEPNLRVMIYCAADTNLNTYFSEIAFPHQVELKVNLDDVKANLRGLKNRPGSTRPADITDQLRKKSGYVNTVTMTYALTQKNMTKQKFYVQVNLVKKISVDTLVETLRIGKTISKEQVLREMRNKAQDADIETTSAVMSLKCPLSTLRIDVPCRSISCNHNQCFDAASFLQLQEQAPTWTCPVCNKATSYESLTVDQYVNDILRNTSRSIDQVTIEPDGNWSKTASPETPGLTNSSKSPADDDNDVDDDDDDDDDDDIVEVEDFRIPSIKRASAAPPLTPSTNTHTPPSFTSREPSTSVAPSSAPRSSISNKRPISAVVDLTLSSDDEDDSPPVRPPPKRPSLASSEMSSSGGNRIPPPRYSFGMPPGPGGQGSAMSPYSR